MRYAQRGGYTPAEQQRRERLRLQAAERFARGDGISEIAHGPRVTPGSVRRWHPTWQDGRPGALRSKGPDLAPCCRAGGNAPLNGTDVLPVRGMRRLSASALRSMLRCALDVLVKEPPDAASGITAAAPRSTRTSPASGHNRTRRCSRRAERSGWIAGERGGWGRQGSSGISRPGRNREGRAGPHRRPARAGKQATPGSVDRGAGRPGLAVKAGRRRGIPVVSRHPGIKRKGLGVSWLTHCRNRLSRRWMIRSRS